MATIEHVARSITEFYLTIALPDSVFPPDSVSHDENAPIWSTIHKLGDARLTKIRNHGYELLYMRFYGLAAEIPDSERQILNFPASSTGDDLVVACPEITSPLTFQIIPNEAIHNARRRQQIVEVQQSKIPRHKLPMVETRWAMVSSDRYMSGIYKHNDGPPPFRIEDVSERLPKTTEACLSVAGLLVMRDVDLFLPVGVT